MYLFIHLYLFVYLCENSVKPQYKQVQCPTQMIMMIIRIESCDKAMIVIQWNWIINTFWQLMEMFREVYFLPIIVSWCYAESPSADCCELWFNTNWILFQCIFSSKHFDHIRKIDIMGYHGNGPYLNIQCTTHLLLSSYFRLSSSFVLFRKAKRALWFWAVGYMSNNLTLLVFISSDLFKRCCNHYIYL